MSDRKSFSRRNDVSSLGASSNSRRTFDLIRQQSEQGNTTHRSFRQDTRSTQPSGSGLGESLAGSFRSRSDIQGQVSSTNRFEQEPSMAQPSSKKSFADLQSSSARLRHFTNVRQESSTSHSFRQDTNLTGLSRKSFADSSQSATRSVAQRQEEIQQVIKQRGGKTSSGSEIQLGYREEGLRGGVKLSKGNWDNLETKLKDIKEYYDRSKSSDITEERKQHCESLVSQKLRELKKKIDDHIDKSTNDSDYRYLDKLNEHLPDRVEDSTFTDSVKMCLDYIEDGKK